MANSDAVLNDLPYPLVVDAATGLAAPPIPIQDLAGVLVDLPDAAQRSLNATGLGTDWHAGEPNDLTQAGWGVIMASDADPAIVKQLQPLIDMRQGNVQDPATSNRNPEDPTIFKTFMGDDGVQPGETAESWARRHGVSLTAPVNPIAGVPYYLLIVGSPERISFEFQALLKMQWAVGRLYFDDVEDYGRYAQAVVAYENENFKPVQRKNAAVWVTRNAGDLATAMLCGAVSQDFLSPTDSLGMRAQFSMNAFTSEKATKPQLIEVLRGNVPGGPPAVIFAGSHGCEYKSDDPVKQRRMQGSLLTQEWTPGTPAGPSNQFCADDIPADARLQGAVGFLFGCYSGGCPAQDGYRFAKDGSPINVAPAPFISRLPQALLSRGMLAVIAHIDLAFPYAFQDTNGIPQPQAIRTPLELLMRGKRIGLAADALSGMWSTRSAQLDVVVKAQGVTAAAPAASAGAAVTTAPVISPMIARMTIARDDARNYIVLGDPATRLRINKLG